MTSTPPVISPAVPPSDAVHSVLTWLAEVVEDVTVVKSKQALKRSLGGADAYVTLQSSTRSRRGIGAWARLSMQVRDQGFGRWRAAHPDLTWRSGPLVHSTGVLGASVVLYGDHPGRHRVLAELPDLLRNELLPEVQMFESPARVAEQYDASRFSAFSCMEWAAYRGDLDAGRTLLRRYAQVYPAALPKLRDAAAAGRPPEGTPIRDEHDWWGPTLAALGVLAPGEPPG